MESDPSTADVTSIIPEEHEEEEVKPKSYEESILIKTIRLILNIITHILIFITVFVVLVYACKDELGVFELHIILGVLGFQFLMNQGFLALSQYNSWSIHLPRKHKRHVHWIFELIGVVLVTVGSALYMLEMTSHFDTIHGILGLLAIGASYLSVLNGLFSYFSYKLKSDTAYSWVYVIHAVSGILTVVFSTGSLCVAFYTAPFKVWLGASLEWFTDEDTSVNILSIFTALFSVLVTLDLIINCTLFVSQKCCNRKNK